MATGGNAPFTGLRNIVRCPICFDLDGVPKVLPCQHTMCQGCISSLTRIRPNTVICPLCRKQTTIPSAGPGNLHTNLTIVQLRDMMGTTQKQGKRKACQYCRKAGQNVSHICKDCEEQFCGKCATNHSSKRFFTDHKPVLIAMVVCSDHKRPFTFFCLDCNRLLCFACHNRDICDGHQIVRVDSLKTENEAAMKALIKEINRNIEANKREIQPAKMALIAGLESANHIKQEIKEQGKKLKDQIDVQVKTLLHEVDKHEHSLNDIQEQVESDDHLVTLCKLKQTAEAACNGGIEQTLLTLPKIQAALPPNPKHISPDTFNKLVFTPQDSINVGVLHLTGSTVYKTNIKSLNMWEKENINQDSFNVGVQHETESILLTTNIKNFKVWEKANIGACVCDVVHLRKEKIAIIDGDNKNIILMDREGQVLADSRQKGVRLQGPRGIAYHPTQDCLLVCDYGGGYVTFLHPTTLCEMLTVKMSGISRPAGVCVMSDGNIVVSGAGQAEVSSVGVFDIHGTQIHLWPMYDRVDVEYVAVDDEDNILVSGYHNNKIIKSNKTGRFLCEWSTRGNPGGLTVAGDIVLVAEDDPDCVMAYNLQGGDARQVLAWDEGQQSQFGMIRSLSIEDNEMTVVGINGLQMYKLTTKLTFYKSMFFNLFLCLCFSPLLFLILLFLKDEVCEDQPLDFSELFDEEMSMFPMLVHMPGEDTPILGHGREVQW